MSTGRADQANRPKARLSGRGTAIPLGTVLGDRFELLEPAGSGGMGAIYAAHDRHTGERVALKILLGAHDSEQRFVREARLLASLRHPAIVRHIAHGPSPHGPFLAMTWLEGEDLRTRLKRETLSLEQTLALVRRATEALAAAHRTGVLHRDVKPSNLFLVDGEPGKLQLIDFGVARPKEGAPALTRTGVLVGTVGYMSPEQARGRRTIDERADLFSLGSVFYECLTGRAAFGGHNAVAVLASVMMTTPAPVRAVRPEIPRAVEDLVTRLMTKDPAERPESAEAVLEALDRLGNPTAPAPSLGADGSVRLTGSERRLRTLVVVKLERSDAQPTREELDEEERALERVVTPFDAQIAPVAADSYLVLAGVDGPATDQAARAGSCAIAIAEAFPEARISISTERTIADGPISMGPSVSSAVDMLSSTAPRTVSVDPVTAGLLGPRFHVEGNVLHGHAPGLPGARKLLGRETPCVGRRKELRLLRDTLEECLDEACVQAVLVTAPAGAGKSRLRHELVLGVDRDRWTVLEAAAEAVGAGSPSMLARRLIASALEGEPTFEALREHAATLDLEAPQRTAEFLAEIVGSTNEGDPTPQLQVARNDRRVMAEWRERSFVEWLGALARKRPLLVVLEDLHWGDAPTIGYLSRALEAHAEAPWMLLGCARPEVDEAFPRLWSSSDLQRVALTGLSKKAGAELVRAVVDLPEGAVDEIVTRADGNAFFLEELIRHAADRDDSLPETVLAMLEGRLIALEPRARRVAHVASVLGERFLAPALEALSGDEDTAGWVDHLVGMEIFRRERTGRGIAFRHGLLRDAAYGMLAPEDKRAAHRAAAEWLSAEPGADPLIVAQHFESANQRSRAVPWLLEAARAAYAAGDIAACAELSARGREAGAEGETLGELMSYAASTASYAGEYARALGQIPPALENLPPGSEQWMQMQSLRLFLAVYLGRTTDVAASIMSVLAMERFPAASALVGRVTNMIVSAGLMAGKPAMVDAALQRAEEAAREHPPDLSFRASMLLCRAASDQLRRGVARGWPPLLEGLELARESGDLMPQLNGALFRSILLEASGAPAAALELVDQWPAPGLAIMRELAEMYLGQSYFEVGRGEEALASAARTLAKEDASGNAIFAARQALAREAIRRRERDEALEQLALGREAIGGVELSELEARASWLTIAAHLGAGDAEAALREATRAKRFLEPEACVGDYARSGIHQVRTEALLAAGQEDEAKEALREALQRLHAIRDGLPAKLAAGYLDGLESHRRTMALATEHLD